MTTTHQFIVTVDVDDWDATDERTPEQYAAAALSVASLHGAAWLEGFADLHAEADIAGIEPLGGMTP